MINQFSSLEILKIKYMISIKISILIKEIRDTQNPEEKVKLKVELDEYKNIHSKLESYYLQIKEKELSTTAEYNSDIKE